MSTRYQYENLLREPVEYRSATVYLIASMIMLLIPNIFFMPKSIATIGALVLLMRSLVRFYQGYKLQEYQLFLPQLGSFQISAEPLQKVKKAQWIGLGFLWDGRHTQRLFDLEKPENRHLVSDRSTVKATTSLSIKSKIFVLIKRILPRLYQQKHELPLPAGGGKAEIHAVGLWEGERDIGIYFSEHIGHSLILGQAKTGKTNLLEIELIQAIARKDHILLIDMKGSPNLLKRAYQQAKELNMTMTLTSDYSSILCTNITWSYHLLIFPKAGHEPHKEKIFILRYMMFLIEVAQKLKYQPEQLPSMMASPSSHLFKELQQYIKKNSTKDLSSNKEVLSIYYQSPQIHTDYYSAIYELLLIPTNELINLLDRHSQFIKTLLNSTIIRQSFSNKNHRKFSQLFSEKGGLIYFNLKTIAFEEILSTYINIIQEELMEVAHTKKYFQPLIIADELAHSLPSNIVPFIDTINQIKARLSLYEPDIPKVANQPGSVDHFLSLFNQLIILRSSNQYICDYLMQRQKDVYVITTDLISGAADNSNIHSDVKFSSSTTLRQTRQRTHLLSLHDFASLPIGQAFCLLEGNQLYKIRIPLVRYSNSISMEETINILIEHLEHTYHPSKKTTNNITPLRSCKHNHDDSHSNIGITSILSSPDNFIE